MTTAPALYGTTTEFTYDGPTCPPEPGHFLLSSGGSGYLILSARHMRSKYPARWWLRLARIDPAEIPEDAMVHRLVWYPRNRQR